MSKEPGYYIASRLENVEQVRQVKARLDAAGWRHTYDWTVHGSVQTCDPSVISEVAAAEAKGVLDADVVIVLLPGGRGTHVELGLALAADPRVGFCLRTVAVYSPNPVEDFGTTGKTCAFYHHADVQQYDDLEELYYVLLNEEKEQES